MAAISRNKYDIYQWIVKVINSCNENIKEGPENKHNEYNWVLACRKLVKNFYTLYNDKYLYDDLLNKLLVLSRSV